jgi:preprotein translocase subunit Sec63
MDYMMFDNCIYVYDRMKERKAITDTSKCIVKAIPVDSSTKAGLAHILGIMRIIKKSYINSTMEVLASVQGEVLDVIDIKERLTITNEVFNG